MERGNFMTKTFFLFLLSFFMSTAYGTTTVPNTFTSGDPISANDMNSNFTYLETLIDSGSIPINPTSISSTIPLSKGGTNNISYSSNQMVVVNSIGTILSGFTVGSNEIPYFNGSTWGTIPKANLAFANGTNIAAMTVGPSTSSDLTLQAGGATKIFLQNSVARVGINTVTPQAALEIVSVNKGFLPPRITDVPTNLSSPQVGEQAYDNMDNRMKIMTGTGWKHFAYEAPGFVATINDIAPTGPCTNIADIVVPLTIEPGSDAFGTVSGNTFYAPSPGVYQIFVHATAQVAASMDVRLGVISSNPSNNRTFGGSYTWDLASLIKLSGGEQLTFKMGCNSGSSQIDIDHDTFVFSVKKMTP